MVPQDTGATHQGRLGSTCPQMFAWPTFTSGVSFAQLKKLSRSPGISVSPATGQAHFRREAWAVRGPRVPGGHRLACLLNAWPGLKSAIYFLDGDIKMIIFCTKTCIQFQAYEIITQPVIANSLCSFRYSIYAFCFFFFFLKSDCALNGCCAKGVDSLSSGAALAPGGDSVLACGPPVCSGGPPPFTPTSLHCLKGAHVLKCFKDLLCAFRCDPVNSTVTHCRVNSAFDHCQHQPAVSQASALQTNYLYPHSK